MFQIFHRKLSNKKIFLNMKNLFYFRSFVIPICDGKEDRHITSIVSVHPDSTIPSLVKQPLKHRIHKNDK